MLSYDDEVARLIAQLDESERGGVPRDVVAATWRFAGIGEDEAGAWIDAGVFDGHRAGLLRMAGVRAQDLLALVDAREVGLAFSLGQLSVIEVRELIADAAPPSSRSPWEPSTGVRRKGLSRHSFRVTSVGNRSSRT